MCNYSLFKFPNEIKPPTSPHLPTGFIVIFANNCNNCRSVLSAILATAGMTQTNPRRRDDPHCTYIDRIIPSCHKLLPTKRRRMRKLSIKKRNNHNKLTSCKPIHNDHSCLFEFFTGYFGHLDSQKMVYLLKNSTW